jgi:hypothetical protein
MASSISSIEAGLGFRTSLRLFGTEEEYIEDLIQRITYKT